MSAVSDTSLVHFGVHSWEEKLPGIRISEAPGLAGISMDVGQFTARYPMHLYRTITIAIFITGGRCHIEYLAGTSAELGHGSRLIIPPGVGFAIEPDGIVSMIIGCTPEWSADDVEMLE